MSTLVTPHIGHAAGSLTITNTIRPSGYGHGHETRRICGVAVLDTNADSCEFNVTSDCGCFMHNCIVSCMYSSFTTWYNDLRDVRIGMKSRLPHEWGRKFPVCSYILGFLKDASSHSWLYSGIWASHIHCCRSQCQPTSCVCDANRSGSSADTTTAASCAENGRRVHS